ncbi:EI24 domain-containing protein [Rhodoferax sp.]|uniref:EI24 domain-containing protein n=1 Tax=Rhodoferax sp. TaxID=50421 RepID=UPI00262BB785|nr:EI24 domain-containing protein [Rhodoferax sp.]MDD2918424.1 EI24 domain-containing protein [Rhodoferax sp.]
MSLLFDSFWRAVAYGLRPRVIALSFLPLLLMAGLALGLGYFYWTGVLATVNLWLESSTLVGSISGWLQGMGLGNLKAVLGPLIVIFAVTPLIVVFSLLAVALMMTPALTSLVAQRRFPALERKRGGPLVASLWRSLVSTLLALVALIVSVPLWLIPPLILILPPLIWGWLTYRVMAFDALAEHASSEERRELFRRHRMSLLGIGIFCGYLGAAPSLIWASGVLFVAAFVVLVPLAIWLYTLVFALASLWFAHFCLAALQALRAERAAAAVAPTPPDADIPDSLPLFLNHARDPIDTPNPERQ